MSLLDHRPIALDNVDSPKNLAADYGVIVSDKFRLDNNDVDLAKGQLYYEAIYVYHLTPEENLGGRYIYVDTFDLNLNPLVCYNCIEFTWGDGDYTVNTDKNFAVEPMGNITMHDNSTFNIWVKGSYPSRVVNGISANHPDEGNKNTVGTHSFYIVFARKVWQEESPNPLPPNRLPVSDFYVEAPTEGPVPFKAQLNDQSTGKIVDYEWLVLNADNPAITYVSDEQHPMFTITEPGEYNISLTVTDDKGNTDKKTLNSAVKVFAAPVPPEVVGIVENRHSIDGRGTVVGGNIYRDRPDGFGYQLISFSIENVEGLIAEARAKGVSYILAYSVITRLPNEVVQFMDDTPELN